MGVPPCSTSPQGWRMQGSLSTPSPHPAALRAGGVPMTGYVRGWRELLALRQGCPRVAQGGSAQHRRDRRSPAGVGVFVGDWGVAVERTAPQRATGHSHRPLTPLHFVRGTHATYRLLLRPRPHAQLSDLERVRCCAATAGRTSSRGKTKTVPTKHGAAPTPPPAHRPAPGGPRGWGRGVCPATG